MLVPGVPGEEHGVVHRTRLLGQPLRATRTRVRIRAERERVPTEIVMMDRDDRLSDVRWHHPDVPGQLGGHAVDEIARPERLELLRLAPPRPGGELVEGG